MCQDCVNEGIMTMDELKAETEAQEKAVEKARVLCQQILMMLESEFDLNVRNTGTMNTLSFAMCAYALRNGISIDHIVRGISYTYTSTAQMLTQKENEVKNTSIN